MIRFCPIASGSSGNCVYFGTDSTHLLIDAGLSGKRVEQALQSLNVPVPHAILVTHEHSDHISGVGIMARRYKIPVYASPKTWRYLLRHGSIGNVPEELIKIVKPGERTLINDVEVLPFDIPHDASQPVGYCLFAREKGTADTRKAVIATDMGYATDTVRAHIREANVVLLESNHDIEMLQNGSYPRALKDRVMGSRGHLSNVAAGALLAEAITDNIQHIFLGHLSEENNLPMIAYDTVLSILEANGVRVPSISLAERHIPSEMICLH